MSYSFSLFPFLLADGAGARILLKFNLKIHQAELARQFLTAENVSHTFLMLFSFQKPKTNLSSCFNKSKYISRNLL